MRAIRFLGAMLLLTALPQSSAAQQFPSRPITLVVPYAPGGNVDVSARILQAGIGDPLGKPIIVENRPGAGGTLPATMWRAPSPTAIPCSSDRTDRSCSAR